MALYKQVNGVQVSLTSEEEAKIQLAWEKERERYVTKEMDERVKTKCGDFFKIFNLLWKAIDEDKIPGKDSEFYSCISTAKADAEDEISQELGITKEELATERQQVEAKS